MNIINSYFQNNTFEFVENKGKFDLYAIRINTKINEKQYILLFVDANVYPETININDVEWYSLQTRTFISHSGYSIKPQFWNYPEGLYDPQLILAYNTNDKSVYETKHFTIELLNDPRKKTTRQYFKNMSLSTALNTFHCVISKK